MATPDLETSLVETAYARWAPIYDAVCGPVMVQGRRAAAAEARRLGGRVLEVGVGTGLSFDDYDASTEVTGIDLSTPMLAKARARMESGRYPWVKSVAQMDAHCMTFADASFDCVVAQFVITLVEDPERVLSECRRVVRPGGRIILVNHLYSEVGFAAVLSAGRHGAPARSGCGRSFPSRGCRPGPAPTTMRGWSSAAGSRRSASTRWCVLSGRRRRARRRPSWVCHAKLLAARLWDVT